MFFSFFLGSNVYEWSTLKLLHTVEDGEIRTINNFNVKVVWPSSGSYLYSSACALEHVMC